MDSHTKSLRNNSDFISRMQRITALTSKITDIETFNNESSLGDQNLSSYKKQLKKQKAILVNLLKNSLIKNIQKKR